MSHNPHQSRSSRSSRNSPLSSPLPYSQRRPPSDDSTSPASANRHSPYPSANFMAGHSPVPPPSLSARHYPSYVDQLSIPRDPYHSSHAQLPPSHQPIPLIPIHSPTTSIPAHPLQSAHHFTHAWERNYSATPQALISPPRHSQEPLSAMQGPSRSRYPTGGSLNHAHNFTMTHPVFIDVNAPVDNFMKDLLQHTIIGAEFDSADRDPPPRCHPGTRLAILQRCLDFILECLDTQKLRWVVGPAGVGKSAVMQMVVEKVPDGVICASVFLSVNGRDGTKIIMTIAYQLAVECESYSQFIRNEISRDPSLVGRSLSVHFERFIVKPFVRLRLFDPERRFLIAIDGLDECDKPRTQVKLLELISDFCISCPTAPIAWIVASRPEPHITSFFDKVEVRHAYIQEEIQVDSDEACIDVQRYLRDELSKIKLAYSSLRRKREWPPEHEFTTIASAAGGLFAYASMVIRYINDPRYRDPTAQLRHVLEVIAGIPLADMSGRGHPMAQLDALYARILSNIPNDVMINVKEMLLLSSYHPFKIPFRLLCNFLGLSEDAAYGAISYLHAVMRVPEVNKADGEHLEYFHKSFEDFLLDSKRSGFSHNVDDEAGQLMARTYLNIIEQVPHGSNDLADGACINCYLLGTLRGGLDVRDNISLSWPGDERFRKTDADLRRDLYRSSIDEVCWKFDPGHPFFYGSMSCFQALTTRFSAFEWEFPFIQLRDSAFDQLRNELTEFGKLKEVSLRTLDYAAVCGTLDLRFTSPIGFNSDLSDPWNKSCKHEKKALDSLQDYLGWETKFQRPQSFDSYSENISGAPDDGADTDIGLHHIKGCHRELLSASMNWHCDYCSRFFARHLMSNPDRLATVFVDSTGLSYVECSFVDPDDGVSEWRYRFCHSGPPKLIDM